MRVTIVHTEFVYSGGAERIVFEQIQFLRRQGVKVDCCAASVNRATCFPNEIDSYNISSIVPGWLSRLFPHEVTIALAFVFIPFVAYKYRKSDVFVGENQAGPWWAYLITRLTRKPYVSYQNYPTTVTYPRQIDMGAKRNVWYMDVFISLAKPVIVAFDKHVIKHAAKRFSNGQYVTNVCVKAYGVPFINLPGGTVMGTFSPQIHENRYQGSVDINGIKIHKPYVLIMNRHFPAKQFEWGLKALKVLKDKYGTTRLRLVITGNPTSYTHYLTDLSRKLGVEGRIVYTGLVTGTNWVKAYTNALVFVYTAPEEDFGLGTIEAMAHGVPVVAWDNAGPARIINNGTTGYLARLNDLDDFAAQIDRLVSNRKNNYQVALAAYRASKSYSWDKHGKALLNNLKVLV